MTLVLEIEHLLGIAFAARTPASVQPDWPPQPDRVFSALVASWGARGEQPEERRALEWLEAQPVPAVAASGGRARSAATVFVPPNDPQTGRVGDLAVLPATRRRQPRRFPAFRPDDPIVRLIWSSAAPEPELMAALNALAADTACLGHSASLVRCRFSADGAAAETASPRRQIYPGRLAELERNYRAGRRPGAGETVRPSAPAQAEPPHSVFSKRWLVLEYPEDADEIGPVAGQMPDLRASALVAKAVRDTLMAGYKKIGLGAEIPAVVSGHTADGAPLAEPHLAVVPLAFLGWPHADGRVLGFALVPPGAGELLDDDTFQRAVKAIAPWQPDRARREIELAGPGFALTLALAGEARRKSLAPSPYVGAAEIWATCTPIVLDRHLKAATNGERDQEIRALIARACGNIGLPEPARVAIGDGGPAIAPSKHSAFDAAPSAYPSGRAPTWTGWRLPKSIASRRLTHAVLEFDEAVAGPVILGAGRFVGLGLCRALERDRR
jgi:CRISPR-associated protein Csb2